MEKEEDKEDVARWERTFELNKEGHSDPRTLAASQGFDFRSEGSDVPPYS